MIDVIYPCHNRLYYTQITFPRVLHECIISGAKLWVYDDDSADRTSEFIQEVVSRSEYKNVVIEKGVFGNSTYCINRTVEQGKAKWIYKIDNDILIPQGSFHFMTSYMPKDAGFMMMRESGDFPVIRSGNREERSHIGGVGLFRREAFNKPITPENRFFGFTDFQNKSSWKKYRIDADNMNLDRCSWYSRENEYEKKGYGRSLCKVKSVFQPDI